MLKFSLIKRGCLRFVEFEGLNGRLIRWEITQRQYDALRNVQDKFKSLVELDSFINLIS